MSELKNTIFNKNIAEDTSNILLPDTGAVGNGIGFKSNINSNSLNGYLNLLSENIQYLQFTGGLYSDDGDYHEGSIASLVIKKENDYSINQFRRNSNNSKVLNNNPPIKDANILTVNGIDIYEGGTFNDDWDKMSAEYSIEAIANTVMGRDNEGSSNVKMPADVHDDTVINNKYLNEQIAASNTEIDKKLETSRTEINKELEKKQNKLTAGKNIEISEDNVISAAGDLSTKAANVTYDNSKTNLEYISGYDFPKFKTPIADTINLVITNADGSLEYPAAIKKQEDGSYRLKAELQNVQFRGMPVFLKLADNKTDIMGLFNTICQFFDFSELAAKKYNASEGEITVRGAEGEINIEFSFDFTIMYEQQAPKNILLKINVTNIESIPPEDLPQLYGNITITYDIKNRVLREPDRNIFYYISKSASVLELKQENNKVKLTGKVTNDVDTVLGGFYFYNPVIENYFNLTSEHTAGITSSTGKPCKWNINKISGSLGALYLFLIKHQDESSSNIGETFTLDLTPDKNAGLEAVKGGADNVQVLGEALNEKIDKTNEKIDKEVEIIINDKLPDIYDYSGKETLTNKEAKLADGSTRPIYRKLFYRPSFPFIFDGKYHYTELSNFKKRIKKTDHYASIIFTSSAEHGYKFGDGYGYLLTTNGLQTIGIDYLLPPGNPVSVGGFEVRFEYYYV